ncbi:ribosomal maturation YjgA family protein [Clostridium sp.]|uniref:ribosomal maturation YjgA family protein n=1 Tax=Clostridium sp. TaxID=1506 RepID=UPI003FD85673
MTFKRNRLLYSGMLIIVISLGLCSKMMANVIPNHMNLYLGDALWALMIFIVLGFVFREMETNIVAIIGISFCYIIEISQLYHASFIDNIRKTTLGGLVLGYVFSWSDFLGYAIGILIGVILEILWGVIQKHKEMKI